jgi:lipopolysaccharide biosynthesis glycosyltransferase
MGDFDPSAVRAPYQEQMMPSVSRVHTLLCTNALFFQHAAVCITSLLENNLELFFDILIIHQPSEMLDEEKLRRSLAQFPNHALSFSSFAIPRELILPLIPLSHYTLDTYTRLWVGEFFPTDVRRVLYLDADMVVVGSIAPLWQVDLEGALMAAVDIPGSDQGVRLLGMRMEDGYFNAGMLVIDLQQWRATNASDTVVEYIQRNPERVTYDQDALNACFYQRTKRLDFKWNVIRPFYREPIPLPLGRGEIERIRREALIIHFNGGSKPWSYFCDHPRKSEYDKYLRMTEWRDYVPPDYTPLSRVRKAFSTALPQPVKDLFKAVIARVNGGRPAS